MPKMLKALSPPTRLFCLPLKPPHSNWIFLLRESANLSQPNWQHQTVWKYGQMDRANTGLGIYQIVAVLQLVIALAETESRPWLENHCKWVTPSWLKGGSTSHVRHIESYPFWISVVGSATSEEPFASLSNGIREMDVAL